MNCAACDMINVAAAGFSRFQFGASSESNGTQMARKHCSPSAYEWIAISWLCAPGGSRPCANRISEKKKNHKIAINCPNLVWKYFHGKRTAPSVGREQIESITAGQFSSLHWRQRILHCLLEAEKTKHFCFFFLVRLAFHVKFLTKQTQSDAMDSNVGRICQKQSECLEAAE